MTFYEIERKVREIIVDKLGVEESQITLDTSFTDDLGADSLDLVELVIGVESAFNISIPDEIAEKMGPTLNKAFDEFFQYAPREFYRDITTRVLSFRFTNDGKIEVRLKLEDGSWCYADGTSLLPSMICLITFSKWANVLKELENIINDPNCKESDLQHFFESYPELLVGNDYDVVLPQAVIVKDDNTSWKPDFVLTPRNQFEFSKVLDLKTPLMDIIKRPNSGHYNFTSKLWNGIMQVRDYSREFDKQSVRERFKNSYNVDVYKPDLHLIAGRKWDIQIMDRMKELQRETQVKIEDWDTVLERLKRNYT